ncbi:50S ribosomal protein L21 [Candidatus Nomurabacteria bacterium]|nr:50S ribosomal protein L21 [Candidatus Nomurabacteria bacterium]
MTTAIKTQKKTLTKTSPKRGDAFAVIETGGKQYKVYEGDIINIEKLDGDHKAGDKITFDSVVLVDDGKNTKVGAPFVSGSKVEAEFVDSFKGEKVTVIRYRAKSNYFKKNGHRQSLNAVKITSIK